MKNTQGIPKIIHRVLVLLLLSAFSLVILTVAFSSIGAKAAFRLGVWLNVEEVDVDDSAHLEYFAVKQAIDEYQSYRIFIDERYGGSYDAALDFLKFLKQNTDVNIICMKNIDSESVNKYLESGEESMLPSEMSNFLRGFIRKLSSYNQILPPQKRVTISADMPEGKCFIIENGSYDRAVESDGVFDINVCYPEKEDCDPMFNIDSIALDNVRIRFGTLDSVSWYINYLESVSGNFGMPLFEGINQPDCYFLIESGGQIEVENEKCYMRSARMKRLF